MMFHPTAKTGVYQPKNRSKYIGQQSPIFRSSWQLQAFVSLDKNPKILRWASQAIAIPYIDTARQNTRHKYIVDLYFEVANAQSQIEKWLIQIKPYSQSVNPKATKRKSTGKLIMEQAIVQTNHCKWEAATQFCKEHGWHFGVWTQHGINKLC